MQEYYLLALAEPRRDSKVLREASLFSRNPQTAPALTKQLSSDPKSAPAPTQLPLPGGAQPTVHAVLATKATPLSFQLSANSSGRPAEQSAPPETVAAASGTGYADERTSSRDAAEAMTSAADQGIHGAPLPAYGAQAHTSGQASGHMDFDGLHINVEKVQIPTCPLMKPLVSIGHHLFLLLIVGQNLQLLIVGQNLQHCTAQILHTQPPNMYHCALLVPVGPARCKWAKPLG